MEIKKVTKSKPETLNAIRLEKSNESEVRRHLENLTGSNTYITWSNRNEYICTTNLDNNIMVRMGDWILYSYNTMFVVSDESFRNNYKEISHDS